MKLERILCPLDFSEFSTRAFEYAQSLAGRYKSKLLLEHVLHLAFSAYPSYIDAEAIDKVSQGLQLLPGSNLRILCGNTVVRESRLRASWTKVM